MPKNKILPKHPQSYWTTENNHPSFPALENDVNVDVAIIGGGITGMISAYLLVQEGLKVALLEANRLLNGTTGHTTAKVTAQHGLIYNEFITTIGKSKTRLYYEANIEALQFIEEIIKQHQIDCNFSNQDAYMYATTDETAKKLEKEADAYQKIGIEGELIGEIPIDLPIKNALVMREQAQFHPVKFLSAILGIIKEKGVLIFENTTAVNIKQDERPTVLTREGPSVTANQILICSHFPFYEGLGLYSARMHASRSYVIAAKTKRDFPGGMYISADKPTRSLRSVTINDEEMVLIVGEDHKTGQGIDTQKHYEALAAFGEQTFGLERIAYHWSAQDLITLDSLPYVGEITSGNRNILIATGYRKWGMTNGVAASLLMCDMVRGRTNRYEKVFTPSRFYAHPGLKNFFSQNINVVSELIKGKLELTNINPHTLANDEGAIISIEGERKGAYKDENGKLHIVDTTCTHIGCEVEWNSGERTWDCPCHGSRFSYTGDVLEGPAEKPLQPYDYKMIDNLMSDDSGY